MTTAAACYQIPTHRVEELNRKVAKLGRRCARLCLAPLALVVHRADERVRYVSSDANGRPIIPARRMVLPCTWVELTGDVPVIAGYLFLARVEHTEAGNIVTQPATDMLGPSYDLTSYRTAKPMCQHCKKDRTRKDTFVLRSPEGTIIQIGRNCLSDFLRTENAEDVVHILQFVKDLEDAARDEDGGDDGEVFGGRWVELTATAAFLAAACQSTRKDGFKPSSFDKSTKSRAGFLSGPRPRDTEFERAARADWDANRPTEEDVKRAAEVMAWVAASTDSSDYMHNMRVACALPSVSHRHSGILASAPASFEKAMGRDAIRRAEKAATADSVHRGEVKVRDEWRLTVIRKSSWDNDFGTVTLHVMADSLGNVFTWKKSGSSDTLEIGKTYDVRGTVKKHSDYKGTKQTELSRCIATEVEAQKPAKSDAA